MSQFGPNSAPLRPGSSGCWRAPRTKGCNYIHCIITMITAVWRTWVIWPDVDLVPQSRNIIVRRGARQGCWLDYQKTIEILRLPLIRGRKERSSKKDVMGASTQRARWPRSQRFVTGDRSRSDRFKGSGSILGRAKLETWMGTILCYIANNYEGEGIICSSQNMLLCVILAMLWHSKRIYRSLLPAYRLYLRSLTIQRMDIGEGGV